MIIYFDERKMAERFQNEPAALREKRGVQFGEWLDSLLPSTEMAANGSCVRVNLAGQADALQKVLQYMENAGAACCDVESADILWLCGRSPASLAITRGLEQGTIVLDRLEPNELSQRLRDVMWKAIGGQIPTSFDDEPELAEAVIVDDLIGSGFHTAADEKAYQDWIDGDRKAAEEKELAQRREVLDEIQRRDREAIDPFAPSGEVW